MKKSDIAYFSREQLIEFLLKNWSQMQRVIDSSRHQDYLDMHKIYELREIALELCQEEFCPSAASMKKADIAYFSREQMIEFLPKHWDLLIRHIPEKRHLEYLSSKANCELREVSLYLCTD